MAIETYPDSSGLFSKTLSGTHDAAKEFYRWLIDSKNLSYDCIFVCSDGPVNDPGHPDHVPLPDGSSAALLAGATRPEIIRVIRSIIAAGQDNTGEFYFFFSGHGFGYQISQYQLGTDVLITREFHKADDSGGACIKLSELRTRFYMSLGGCDHYYFVDACRNVISEEKIQVLDLGMPPSIAQLGFPTMYTLYSVKYGESAPLNAKFPAALRSGLVGSGHAKGWAAGEMFVKFDLLCRYIDDQSNPPHIDSRREGNGNGNLLKLPPASVLSDCDVIVDGGAAADQFTLETSTGSTSRQDSFRGSSFTMKLEPNDRTYAFRLTGASGQYEMYDPPATVPLDFYSSNTLRFRRVTGILAPHLPLRPEGVAALKLTFSPPTILEGPPPDWKVELEDLQTGTVLGSDEPADAQLELPPGAYVARLREDGVTAVRRFVRLGPGSTETLDLLHREPNPTQQAILAAVNSDPHLTIANFSETLGPTAHWNLQLWLAYLGAAHIMKKPDMYYKLGRIPLASLDTVAPGGSIALVLVVSDAGVPSITAHRQTGVTWMEMKGVVNVPNLYQGTLALQRGWSLLSIALPNLPPLTFASCGLPNRAVLFIMAPDASGRLSAQQFLLPLAHLRQNLPFEEWWDHGPASNLKLVGLMSLAQQRFASRKPAAPDEGRMYDIWKKLFEAKWTDPLLGLIALYDIIRRGAREHSPYPVEIVLGNLLAYFPELPDIAILKKLFGIKPEDRPEGVPLFLDGFLASGIPDLSPLPISQLDFNSLYTSWRNGVTGSKPVARALTAHI